MSKKLIIIALIALSITTETFSQGTGINTTGASGVGSAGLDVNFNNKGILVPRVELTSTTVAAPVTAPVISSLLIYNTATVSDVTPGYYYWAATKWVRLHSDVIAEWRLTGNAGTVDGIHFIGTTDNVPFNIRVSNQKAGRIESNDLIANTFYGYQSGNVNPGTLNVGIGFRALHLNNGGDYNTASGYNSLYSNSIGDSNTAIGYQALYTNAQGNYNTANGQSSLYSNIGGDYNTAIGSDAHAGSRFASYNTSIGSSALSYNPDGYYNTAKGVNALNSNTTGTHTTADGYSALSSSNGAQNTANGYQTLDRHGGSHWTTANGSEALYYNIGASNTAKGRRALYTNYRGFDNTAYGTEALYSNDLGRENTAIGYQSQYYNVTGNFTTSLGYFAGSGGSVAHITALGYDVSASASIEVRIGNTNVSSIGGQVSWTTLSDVRFKTDIQKNVPGLDFIKKLQPVTYTIDIEKLHDFLKKPDSLRSYSHEQAKLNKPATQTGFLAQDVEKAAKELGFEFSGVDAPKSENDYYGLRYAEFVVPLVKAMQEQQEQIENSELKLKKQQPVLEELKKELNEIKEVLKLNKQFIKK
jgi:trimeric autotransporter adhesin